MSRGRSGREDQPPMPDFDVVGMKRAGGRDDRNVANAALSCQARELITVLKASEAPEKSHMTLKI
jgi:hypothetical protein